MPTPSDEASTWRSRSFLYRASLVALMAGIPVHLVAILLPFWLEFQHKQQQEERVVSASFGLWQVCLLSQCYSVNSIETRPVGAWLVSVKILMLGAFLLHSMAVVAGTLQNFMSRRRIRQWSSVLCQRLVHRDSEVTEDVGFLAGFFGQAAHIVFILCVKEELSDSAKLSWGFGFGFLATGTAAVSSLAMTKAHSRPLPRLQPPSASEERQTADVPLSNVDTARGAASSPRASGQPQPRAPRDRRSREAVGYL
ncbi:hypothetical protein C0Q70_01653 [Pomacea canaliculata]|uniref:Uncharacterized protein n=1 Tax=Pomacea canaliculata TaxID=400727 RepID=A0A2T7Q021_POMCA|nr:uncharacterized protein LOC112571839 [Pomacea canaliculata]PVD39026.1 hypothetical protein C0Q70_01653 [Pomacea canaliculata]